MEISPLQGCAATGDRKGGSCCGRLLTKYIKERGRGSTRLLDLERLLFSKEGEVDGEEREG
jgi:hypothetical protein